MLLESWSAAWASLEQLSAVPSSPPTGDSIAGGSAKLPESSSAARWSARDAVSNAPDV